MVSFGVKDSVTSGY